MFRSILTKRSISVTPYLSKGLRTQTISPIALGPRFSQISAISPYLQPQHISKRTLITSPIDWEPVKATKKNEWTISKYVFLSLLILMPIISFMLGTWQLRRLKWKNNLIATSEDRLTHDPIALPKNIQPEDAEDWQYRRVIVKGKFDHSREIFVGPKVQNEMKGYVLYTPLIRSDGGEDILIERGFITDENVLPQRRSLKHLSLPEHEVEIECIIKVINPRASLTWEKVDPDSRLWHVLDVEDMTDFTKTMRLHVCALGDMKDHPIKTVVETLPKPWWNFWGSSPTKEHVELDKDTTEVNEFSKYQFLRAGVPIGRSASIDYRNNHLNYLVTWYGLCLASSILLFFVLKKTPSADPLKEKLRHASRHT